MSLIDTHGLENNKNLARHVEALIGLGFRVKGGQDAQFIALSSEVSAHGEVYITGICKVPFSDENSALPARLATTGQVYRFPITELIFTLDAIEKFEVRIANEWRS